MEKGQIKKIRIHDESTNDEENWTSDGLSEEEDLHTLLNEQHKIGPMSSITNDLGTTVGPFFESAIGGRFLSHIEHR